MSDSKVREQFEAWCRRDMAAKSACFERNRLGEYVYYKQTGLAWAAWKASRAALAAPEPAQAGEAVALPMRGDVGKPEATRDPIFLLRWRPRNRPIRGDRWTVEGVWFTREEAEEFARGHAYRWGSDKHGPCWQVYCVPADGTLAALLRARTAYNVAKVPPLYAHPTPRAEAYVEWCARHANIEKVPGPFCPACAYASVMRDGVKMGRESAPRAQPAPEGAGEAVAWRVRMVCCGHDDGYAVFDSHERAEAFRDSYTSGPGVAHHGYSADASESGHRRAAIIEAAPAPASAEAVADRIFLILGVHRDKMPNEAVEALQAVAHALRAKGAR